jgi:DNA-binding response OmpR family regulator
MDQSLHLNEQARPARTQNILCVDADDTSRLLIAEILYEHEVDFALTADDAVQLARSRHYDLCFVDPAVSGFADFDLLTELRAFDTRVPIVICSERERALGDRAGIRARLLKPLSAAAIREAATRLMRSSR